MARTISLLVPVYNEANNIEPFIKMVQSSVRNLDWDIEYVFINDGSTDNSQSILQKYVKKLERVQIINFSRNFGKEAALTAGIDHATGEAVIPIDCDLQDPPELIPDMIKFWQKGFDVVIAKRSDRGDGFLKDVLAKIFHRTVNWLTNGKIPENVGDFRLMDRKVVEAIKSLNEHNRYMKGIFSWVGFKTYTLSFRRPQRVIGKSKFSFSKLFKLGLDGIFSFSSKPLKVWLYLGLIFSIISFLYAMFLIIRTIAFGVDLPGYASIMVSILFMGGIQLISLGVIGEYVARIFKEVKNRPIYIVDESYDYDNRKKKAKAKPKKENKQRQLEILQFNSKEVA